MKKLILVLVTILIVISNLPFVKEMAGINFDYYRYSNYDGSITVHEIFSQNRVMSKKFALGEIDNKEYLVRFPMQEDRIIFRLFKINPLCFWRWGEYIYDWRFRLPYKSWNEIYKKRGKLKLRTNSQEF